MTLDSLVSDRFLTALAEPEHLFSRSEVLSKRTPVPPTPGIYAWYFREIPGAPQTDLCVKRAGLTLLYVGISPKNESSSQNLRKRIHQHFRGNAEGSTLRKTLGVLLTSKSGFPLRRVGSGRRKTFTHAGEQWLDNWMADNALVCWTEHPRPHEVEGEFIRLLSLPFNIMGNTDHPGVAELSEIRKRAVELANEAPVATEAGGKRRAD